MERGLRTAGAVVVLVLLAACSGGGDDDSPAASLQTSTTAKTTTTLSVEAQVEAAYLKSWDVFSHAALELDSSGLNESYAGPALQLVQGEISRLTAEGHRVRYSIDHDYTIEVNKDAATVTDAYVNHSVLLDARTREPLEADPNEHIQERYLMSRVGGQWLVVDILR